ncbi:YkgJ family cysteine cluster protein [Marinifilum sp. JC120]|nr:YkgJ family cysteine cluster protein [Marinifilum sp. JC120]
MNLFEYLELQYRKWRLKRKRQNVVIRGNCKMCGSCCRSICLNVGNKWLKTKKHLANAIDEDEALSRFEICGKTEEGYLKFSCTCLNENGTCDDYENRPRLCRTFPNPSIFMQFGELPAGCGFRMSTEIDFEKVLHEAMDDQDDIKSGHIPNGK